MTPEQLNKIKATAGEFFEKMTIPTVFINANSPATETDEHGQIREVVNLDVKLEEPQILIGQQGQTLFEIQRLLKNILNKQLQSVFYLNLDINDYKKKKVEYLKDFAKETADQIAMTGQEKTLPPMSSYERRIIHAELSQRTDVITESQGDGFDRHVVIKPK